MTQKRFKLKSGDFVQVISGKHKGKRSIIDFVDLENEKVLLIDVNKATRHVRPSEKTPTGAVEKELPLHISNVMLVNPQTDRPERVSYAFDDGGIKKRLFSKTKVDAPVTIRKRGKI